MQLKVDSTEPLENVLSVVGAMYGVELSVTSPAAPGLVPAPAAATGTASRNSARKRSTRATKKATTKRATAAPEGGRRRGRRRAVDSADVRAWARANGHAVKERGRVPAAVMSAYRESGSA
jgi:hypothetical protein